MAPSLRTVSLPSGERVPALGLGTWLMGEEPDRRASELAALRRGLELGLGLVDTAEMYGDGAAETLVGEAIAGRRDEAFVVSKVLPTNASRAGTIAACERSLRRLRTDRIDLYLLHWRGTVPLDETVAAFAELVRAGKIRHWGVSNLDVADLEELAALAPEPPPAADQVLYNLSWRGIELDLLPFCRARRLPVMAYSPIDQGRLLDHAAVAEIAVRHAVSPARVALAWVLRQDGIIAIPKAGSPAHVDENRAALDLRLDAADLQKLDRAFPPPSEKQPLGII